MDKPMVSVIMGVYNQWNEAVLREAVNSILNQTYKDMEFINSTARGVVKRAII